MPSSIRISDTVTLSMTDLDSEPTNAADSNPALEKEAASLFSSIRQTALVLVRVASEQAGQHAGGGTPELASPQDPFVAERRKSAVRAASADYARRTAESSRIALEAFLRHTSQPCLALDDSGRITRWNSAMNRWTGVAGPAALEHPLSLFFSPEAASEIHAAYLALRESVENACAPMDEPVFSLEGPFELCSGLSAAKVSLLPICRVPGAVEMAVVLFEPSVP